MQEYGILISEMRICITHSLTHSLTLVCTTVYQFSLLSVTTLIHFNINIKNPFTSWSSKLHPYKLQPKFCILISPPVLYSQLSSLSLTHTHTHTPDLISINLENIKF